MSNKEFFNYFKLSDSDFNFYLNREQNYIMFNYELNENEATKRYNIKTPLISIKIINDNMFFYLNLRIEQKYKEEEVKDIFKLIEKDFEKLDIIQFVNHSYEDMEINTLNKDLIYIGAKFFDMKKEAIPVFKKLIFNVLEENIKEKHQIENLSLNEDDEYFLNNYYKNQELIDGFISFKNNKISKETVELIKLNFKN